MTDFHYAEGKQWSEMTLNKLPSGPATLQFLHDIEDALLAVAPSLPFPEVAQRAAGMIAAVTQQSYDADLAAYGSVLVIREEFFGEIMVAAYAHDSLSAGLLCQALNVAVPAKAGFFDFKELPGYPGIALDKNAYTVLFLNHLLYVLQLPAASSDRASIERGFMQYAAFEFGRPY